MHSEQQTLPKVKVLLVDDKGANLKALESLLKAEELEIFKALSGEEALELLLLHDFALTLVDVQMPGMNGFELAELMRGAERTKHIPIIFVTAGARDAHFTFKGYETGAVDFLYKPLDPHMVRSKTRVFCELYKQKQLIGSQLEATEIALTAAEEAQAALRLSERQLRDALKSRDEFLSMASHELKTPLTSATLQINLLERQFTDKRREPPTVERTAKLLGNSSKQMRRLGLLIEDLLDVSRIQSGHLTFNPEKFNISELLIELIERFSEQFKLAQLTVRTQIQPDVYGVWDPSRVEQIFVNLLSNAIKYAANCSLEISLAAAAQGVIIVVKDSGPGIPQEFQSKIFERFERAMPAQSVAGLGLGLFIVKRIVDAHRGTIELKSEAGQGAMFTVTLPQT